MPRSNPTRPPARRASRTHSLTSDASFTTPFPTPSPPPTRRGRGLRTTITHNEAIPDSNSASPAPQKSSSKLPAHYHLAQTVPSPFAGTLEASLDAVLEFSRMYGSISGVSRVVSTLLEAVDPQTNWSEVLDGLDSSSTTTTTPTTTTTKSSSSSLQGLLLSPRYIISELFFLVTRTLLPEQIAENRAALARLYDRKKQLAIRLLLRYDMLRERKVEAGAYQHHYRDMPLAVASLPPPLLRECDGITGTSATATATMATATAMAPPPIPAAYPDKYPFRRPLMPNIIATLIAAPRGGFTTHGVRERMKHHITELDGYLVLGDEQVEGWSIEKLKMKTCVALLYWQWLRRNNGVLEDMEVCGWEELEGRADECEWFADEVRRAAAGSGGKKALAQGN